MGITKEFYFETMELGRDWVDLIERILSQPAVGKAETMRPDEAPSDEEEWEMTRLVPDLTFWPEGKVERVAVEFKMFRWRGDAAVRLSDAVAHMREILAGGCYAQGIIVASIELPPGQIAQLASTSDVVIWDLARLRKEAATNEELSNTLEILVGATLIDPAPSVAILPNSKRGASLAAKLGAIPSGDKGWRAFEEGCEEAIGFLFGHDLHNLTPQSRTDDELNRMDLVGRIGTRRDTFWSMLAADFRTRYIVFEAKNYAKPIGQIELEITAKYLSRNGLRSVAIIIARAGASPHADRAAGGILRENGKLLIVVSLADLCRMLQGADAGEPPENILFERMDSAMMRLSR